MSMPDNSQQGYDQWQSRELARWEALCGRCGACCGSLQDPCEHLRGSLKGEYYCDIYHDRFGLRKTVGGREFLCVPIRNILHESWPGDECCGYKKDFRRFKEIQR